MRFKKQLQAADSFSVNFDPETGLLQINELNAGDWLQIRLAGLSHAPVLEIRGLRGHTKLLHIGPSDITAIDITLNSGDDGWPRHAHHRSSFVTVDHQLEVPVTLVTPTENRIPVIALGGGGADSLMGGAGHDRLYGGRGDDTLDGGGENDRLSGGRGADSLLGGSGHDRLYGGRGADSLMGGSGYDQLYGGRGNDTLDGGSESDRLFGGRGADNLIGASGYDRLYGGSGADSLTGGEGDDFIHGGRGFDTAVFSGSFANYIIEQDENNHWRVSGLDGSDFLTRVEAFAFDDYTFFTDGRNNSPFAQPQAATTDEDTSIRLTDLLNEAFDPDDDAITIAAVTESGNGSMVTVQEDGSVIYDPNGAFEYLAAGETAIDSFDVTIADGRGGARVETVTMTITGVNDGPQIVSTETDARGAVTEAGVSVVGSSEANGVLAATGAETGFTATWSGSAAGIYGSFAIGSNGAWTYALDDANAATNALAQNATVSEVFTATVTDHLGETATQDVTVSITGSNDAPWLTTLPAALAGTVTAAGTGVAGTPLSMGQLTADDPDAGHVLSWAETGPTTYGTLSVSSSGLWTYTLDNNLAATRALGANTNVTQSFTVTVQDEFGAQDSQQVDITVRGSNDAPTVAAALVVEADAATAAQVVDLLAGASDLDSGETATLQIVDVVGLVPGLTLSGSTLTLDPDHPDFLALPLGQERAITVAYDVMDAQGARVSQELTVTITGVYTNTAPVTQNDVYTLSENGIGVYGAELGVLANDSDVDTDDTLRLTSFNGTLISGATEITLTSGTVITVDETGAMTIDSSAAFDALGFSDVGREVVSYTVGDSDAQTTGEMTLLVNGVNDAPVALDDTFNTNNGVAQVSGNIFNNNGFGADYDPEGGYAFITGVNGSGFGGFASFTLASGADVSIWSNGNFIYTPVDNAATRTGEFYTDSFSYAIEDEYYAESTATVRFNVEDVLPNEALTIAIAETVEGPGGANGTYFGAGSASTFSGDGSNGIRGGDGEDGGVGTAIIDGQNLLGDNNDDTLTMTATATGGRGGYGASGGHGGDGEVGSYLYSSGYSFVRFHGGDDGSIPTAASADERVEWNAGNGGDGADGGDGGFGGLGQAFVTNNAISAGAGADTVSFAAISTAGSGSWGGNYGDGGRGFSGFTELSSETRDIYYAEYDAVISTYLTIYTSYEYTIDGQDGRERGIDGGTGSAEAEVSGNAGSGGTGNDHLSLVAEAVSPYESYSSNATNYYRTLEAAVADNTLSGDAGNDTLEISVTVDDSRASENYSKDIVVLNNSLSGGADDDTFVLSFEDGYSGYTSYSVYSNTIAGDEGHDILDLSGSEDGQFYVNLAEENWGVSQFNPFSGSNGITGVEEVRGAQGADIIIGSDAAEILGGGFGNDTLTGNGGSDVFVFGAGQGRDVITDFSTDALEGDVVRLVGAGFVSGQAVIDAATDTVAGVQIAIGFDTLLLEGVLRADLSVDDFVFV